MAERINTAPPSGMRDFLPDEVAKRKFVEGKIRQVFSSFGFLPIETPSIENLSTLLGKYGEEGDQLIFRILHRRDKLERVLESGNISEETLSDLGLRYDLTVPLARVVANYPNLPKYFKRYQIQPVWRADRPGKGRFREFYQCDVDIVGTKSIIAEIEVCSAVGEALRSLGFENFTIHVNHRQILRLIIANCGIPYDKEETALIAIDKMDKIGESGVLEELEKRGINKEQAYRLIEFTKRPQSISESDEINRIEGFIKIDPNSKQPLDEIREFLALSSETFLGKHLYVDASLARGLGYYTGLIFEIRAPNAKGSLGGGGRYDGLIGIFAGREIPAVGFSIGFERLILLMEEQKLFPHISEYPNLLICKFPEVPWGKVLQIAVELRGQGLRVEIFPETQKIGKQIAYAESAFIPIVAIIGSDEVNTQTVTLKLLSKGEQITLPVQQVGEQVRKWNF